MFSKNFNRLLFSLFLPALFVFHGAAQTATPNANPTDSKIILPAFETVAAQLKTQKTVPVLLPSEIPPPKFLPRIIPAQEGDTALRFYSSISVLKKSEYVLSIDITPDCKARPNCNYGMISGRKNGSKKPSVPADFQTDLKKAETIALSDGLRGFYTPAPENPKAIHGAEIIWLDGKGNQYLVSLKRGAKEDVIALANSIITNRRNAK